MAENTYPCCPTHGIHRHMTPVPFGDGAVYYCNACLIESLDGIKVQRMQLIELTDEQVKQMEAQQEAAE